MIVSNIKNKFFNNTKKKSNKAKSKKNKDFDIITKIHKVFSGGNNKEHSFFENEFNYLFIIIPILCCLVIGWILYVYIARFKQILDDDIAYLRQGTGGASAFWRYYYGVKWKPKKLPERNT
tara:strand:+ start:895 stop:1257 length:363 start_codon:yes stop_codon:yes gene_type:complete